MCLYFTIEQRQTSGIISLRYRLTLDVIERFVQMFALVKNRND